ncbi:hypothetical protein CSIV_07045 [Microbacterium sp. CSI-V]|uniref:hypothetical protein n=1 Tax=unclassified Microbacterium TaxID=2609290 RepID=UPI00097C812F|nr:MULTISPECIES: hypothetical protein [unclassified Microbacterium]MXS76241.1 hypothetical protein [Microbacterium sp. TL13]ONI64507.1 hypothetical protein CSIV_07045 [Microbacterium sp. CSI-V]
MGEVLHVGALVTTAAGACCVAADRPAARVRELLIAALMLLAMGDMVLGGGSVPAVFWAAALLLAALVAVAPGRVRRGEPRRMRAFDALGAVLMASLLLAAHVPASAGSSHHGAGAMPLVLLTLLGVAAYAVGGVVLFATAHRDRPLVTRLPPLAMGASAVLMAAPLVVG